MISRKILIVPIVLFVLIAFIPLLTGNFLHFWLFLFVAGVLAMIFVPVMNEDALDKYIPVYQIFFILVATLLVFSIIFYFQFRQANLSVLEATAFGAGMSLIAVAVIMILKGK